MIKRLAILLLAFPLVCAADCVPFQKADEKLGEVACVKGRVLKVSVSPQKTAWFLNFCEDFRTCKFAVVAFPRDLKDVGDIRALEGKEIEISGKVKAYNGQTEIILKDRSQLRDNLQTSPSCRRTSTSAVTEAIARERFAPRSAQRTRLTRSLPTRRTPRQMILKSVRSGAHLTAFPSSTPQANTSFPSTRSRHSSA